MNLFNTEGIAGTIVIIGAIADTTVTVITARMPGTATGSGAAGGGTAIVIAVDIVTAASRT